MRLFIILISILCLAMPVIAADSNNENVKSCAFGDGSELFAHQNPGSLFKKIVSGEGEAVIDTLDPVEGQETTGD